MPEPHGTAEQLAGGHGEGRIPQQVVKARLDSPSAQGMKQDFEKIFRVQDLVRSKELAIAATGITDGEFLEGVRFTSNGAVTNSFIARAETHTYRKLETTHFFDYKQNNIKQDYYKNDDKLVNQIKHFEEMLQNDSYELIKFYIEVSEEKRQEHIQRMKFWHFMLLMRHLEEM